MPKGAFKDPWLSVPTSRWVWLCQARIKIPNITDNVLSGAKHAIFEGFLHEGTSVLRLKDKKVPNGGRALTWDMSLMISWIPVPSSLSFLGQIDLPTRQLMSCREQARSNLRHFPWSWVKIMWICCLSVRYLDIHPHCTESYSEAFVNHPRVWFFSYFWERKT